MKQNSDKGSIGSVLAIIILSVLLIGSIIFLVSIINLGNETEPPVNVDNIQVEHYDSIHKVRITVIKDLEKDVFVYVDNKPVYRVEEQSSGIVRQRGDRLSIDVDGYDQLSLRAEADESAELVEIESISLT